MTYWTCSCERHSSTTLTGVRRYIGNEYHGVFYCEIKEGKERRKIWPRK